MTTYSLQRLDWDGAVNAWQIRPGFFRMGRAEALTSRGWDQMVDAGVGTVVDLRNTPEMRRRSTDPVAGQRPAALTRVNTPVHELQREEFWARYDPYPRDPSSYQDIIETFPDMVATAVEAVLAPLERGESVVVHCSAGRDRTGLVVTLALQSGRVPGGGTTLHELLAVHEAALRGINDHHLHSAVPHPIERGLTGEEFERDLAFRARALEKFVRQWTPRRVAEFLDLAEQNRT
ncbi:tyrosine-protein phosphatase [Auritidibacter ignavus]|uniref:tyrosine-protein phosphatase n=1 Tax=Auritidibacter TaxID=1160973 RepID=UPI000D73C506|nr:MULTISPECIES: tyrosine-protein phosphatase [Auritidibacter]AXR74919.1 protein-tyrosine-phosphatase [Auritidibacter sp. NML130574]PXA76909.1 protein tyrosine phosphatase [Auritidibacter sp. NML120779]WGH81475.1 tyrosine-protein phosphatase [Auritidibacter ignavus]